MKPTHNNLTKLAKRTLGSKFSGITDEHGYFRSPQENLVPGVSMEQFEDELRAGDGNELRMKFYAVHSSAALAVNCFAPFKSSHVDLRLLGQTGGKVNFEKKLKLFNGRRGPNIDVWVERTNDIVAIESKFLEHLTPKKAEFGAIWRTRRPRRLSMRPRTF